MANTWIPAGGELEDDEIPVPDDAQQHAALVNDAAEASEIFGDDALEKYAAQQQRALALAALVPPGREGDSGDEQPEGPARS